MDKGKSSHALLIIFLLSFSSLSFLPMGIVPMSNAQSGTTTCPSNSIFNLVAYGGAPPNFNFLSLAAVSEAMSVRLMYYSLIPIPTPSGTPNWKDSVSDWYTYSPNYTIWTFNVRPGLKWSNGQNVTSQDIINTYSTQFALNSSYDFVGAHTEIKSETPLNTSAVQFVLNAPDAQFATKISGAVFTDIYPSSFTQNGPSYNGFGADLVTDGPFYVSNYSTGSTQAVFLRNPYFNPLPNICEISTILVESQSQTATYLSSGTADLAPIQPGSVSAVLKNPNIHLLDIKGLQQMSIGYNVSMAPYNNVTFRQALAYAINFTAIQQTAEFGYTSVGAGGIVPQGAVSPVSTEWYNPNQKSYSYNTSEALSLLNSIGIKKGSDGYLQYPNGTDVSLTMYADSDYTDPVVAGGFVQTNLQTLGFKVNLIPESLGTIIGASFKNVNGIWGAMILDESGAPIYGSPYLDALPSYDVYEPYAAYPTWEGASNSIAQTQYESNLTAIESTQNTTLQHQYLDNIQALNAENLPIIFLAYNDQLFGYNTQRWTGWTNELLTTDPFVWNTTALAMLTPVSTTSPTSQVSTSVNTTSSPISNNNNLLLAISVVIVAVIVLGSVAFLMRRRGRPAT